MPDRHDEEHRQRAGPRAARRRERAVRRGAGGASARAATRRCRASGWSIDERVWSRLAVDGARIPHSVRPGRAAPRPFVRLVAGGGRRARLESGIRDLLILKSTARASRSSRAASTRRCPRPTIASWRPRSPPPGVARLRRPSYRAAPTTAIVRAMLAPFATRYSPSVQATLFEMGTAALDACPEIEAITLSMPNLHCLRIDLSPFGRDNRQRAVRADRRAARPDRSDDHQDVVAVGTRPALYVAGQPVPKCPGCTVPGCTVPGCECQGRVPGCECHGCGAHVRVGMQPTTSRRIRSPGLLRDSRCQGVQRARCQRAGSGCDRTPRRLSNPIPSPACGVRVRGRVRLRRERCHRALAALASLAASPRRHAWDNLAPPAAGAGEAQTGIPLSAVRQSLTRRTRWRNQLAQPSRSFGLACPVRL